MDDFSFNTNFLGRDGFTLWIGQIAPYAATETQDGENGWGCRYKVRIMGYHPYTDQLADEDLPWAIVMRPPKLELVLVVCPKLFITIKVIL